MGVIADMIRAGIDPELIERVHAEIVSAGRSIDAQAERRRMKDRERKREKRPQISAESAESAEQESSPYKDNHARARVFPVGISNDIPPIDSPLPSEGPQPNAELDPTPANSISAEKVKRISGCALPDDWNPPEELFSYGDEHGLSRSQTAEIIEGMRLWARANRNQAKARKADWIAAMQGAIRRDAAKFKARAGPMANRGGVGKLLFESIEKHGDLTINPSDKRHDNGSEKAGIAKNVLGVPIDRQLGRSDGSEHGGVISGNDIELLVGHSYRRM